MMEPHLWRATYVRSGQDCVRRAGRLALWAALMLSLSLGSTAEALAQNKPAPRYVLLGELGLGGGTSSWRGDYLGCGSLLLGARFFDWVTIHGQLREGYADVDQRLVTTLAFGVGIAPRIGERLRLTAKISGVHQHEESIAVAREDPLLVPFGVGSGIRHRMGGELALGARYTVLALDSLSVTAGGEAFGFLSPDDRGPSTYFGVLALLSAEVAL